LFRRGFFLTRIVVVVMSEIKVSNNTENNVENLENTAHDTTYLDEADVDAELEAMKKRLQEMEEEANRLKEVQSTSEVPSSEEVDRRSVYVGNVDYGSTPEELQAHFKECGTINRVTILCDKFTGHPKGFAYIEFATEEGANNAVILNESLFRGRNLKVSIKRTNVPGISSTDRGGRGMRGFPRGMMTMGFRGRGGFVRGGGFRGGGRPYYGYRGRGRMAPY
jgi:polyadenylate-binding protein 2